MHVDILEERFTLFPEKAIFWNRRGVLLVSDLHLGKINHFRRAGIPVPSRVNDHNIEILVDVIHACRPDRVICLGDLFHSHYNSEWEVFGEVVRHFSGVSFELVLGNHDIMGDYQYVRKGITVHDTLQMGPFLLTHHPLDVIPEGLYNIAGHVHPGVTLRGRGRQGMTLPCFYFGQTQALLPAFGKFTGLAKIAPRAHDRVFVITAEKVLEC